MLSNQSCLGNRISNPASKLRCNFERPAVPAVWLRGAFSDSARRVGVPGQEARETGH